MTAAPRFTVPRVPERGVGVRRKGRIYLFTTLRVHESGPNTGMVLDGTTEDGYVGKTRQTLAQREQQHRGGSADGEPVPGEDLEEQPWFDVTVGGIRLVEQGVWTDGELAEREQYWIDQIKPRYNYLGNCANKRRIPKPVAREHRDRRDLARGVTPRQWQPFSTQRRTAVDSVAPAAPGRVWPVVKAVLRSPWTWWLLAWASTVLTAWIAVGWTLAELGEEMTAGWRLLPAATLATAGVGRVWWWATGRKKWRRFKRRW
jgi:hypothetical protein